MRSFAQTGKRNPLRDREQISHIGRCPWHNHVCNFLWRSVKGFGRGKGSSFQFSHWLASSTVQHSRTTVRECDQKCWSLIGWNRVTWSALLYGAIHCTVVTSSHTWRPPRPATQCRQFQEEAKDASVSECTWTLSALEALRNALYKFKTYLHTYYAWLRNRTQWKFNTKLET